MLVSALLAEGIEDGLGSHFAHFFPEHQLFDVRGFALESLLDLATEELRGGHAELLALLAIDSQQLFGRVIVILDLFFRAH